MQNNLQTERLPSGKRLLLTPLVRETDDPDVGTLVVGEAFVTDFSSIPFWAAWIVRWSRVDVAGVVHDCLYAKQLFPRRTADRIWFKIARRGPARANLVQAWVCWLGLRLGGWVAWGKHKRRNRG